MAIRVNDAATRTAQLLNLRDRAQNRYLLVSARKGSAQKGVAFGRWSDQLKCGSNVDDANILKVLQSVGLRKKEGNLKIFDLNRIYDKSGPKSDKDGLAAVSKALADYGIVSLPARLINPSFRMEGLASFENGISLLSPDQANQMVPGCFICGRKDGKKDESLSSITGFVQSEEAFFALSIMFGDQGIATGHDPLMFRPTSDIASLQFRVKIGACYKHSPIISTIRDYSSRRPKYITKELMELQVILGGRILRRPNKTQKELIELIRTRLDMQSTSAEKGSQFGFRFF